MKDRSTRNRTLHLSRSLLKTTVLALAAVAVAWILLASDFNTFVFLLGEWDQRFGAQSPSTEKISPPESFYQAPHIASKNHREIFQEAWYIDDEPDLESFHRIYEDEHILSLKQNTSYQPFIVPVVNGEPSIATANIHPIFTALRSLDEADVNPICSRYVFPNIAVFPTISVIIPVQNGEKKKQDEIVCSEK
jgi:hypothetical protein